MGSGRGELGESMLMNKVGWLVDDHDNDEGVGGVAVLVSVVTYCE
jgi:hypothetical protein